MSKVIISISAKAKVKSLTELNKDVKSYESQIKELEEKLKELRAAKE